MDSKPKPNAKNRVRASESGAVMVEFLIAYLPVLVAFLMFWQLGELLVAQLVVERASSAAGRAAIVVLPDDPAFYAGQAQAAYDGQRKREVRLAAGMMLAASPHLSENFNVDVQNIPAQGDDSVQELAVEVDAEFRCNRLRWVCGADGVTVLKASSQHTYHGANYEYEPTDLSNLGSANTDTSDPGCSDTDTPGAGGKGNGSGGHGSGGVPGKGGASGKGGSGGKGGNGPDSSGSCPAGETLNKDGSCSKDRGSPDGGPDGSCKNGYYECSTGCCKCDDTASQSGQGTGSGSQSCPYNPGCPANQKKNGKGRCTCEPPPGDKSGSTCSQCGQVGDSEGNCCAKTDLSQPMEGITLCDEPAACQNLPQGQKRKACDDGKCDPSDGPSGSGSNKKPKCDDAPKSPYCPASAPYKTTSGNSPGDCCKDSKLTQCDCSAQVNKTGHKLSGTFNGTGDSVDFSALPKVSCAKDSCGEGDDKVDMGQEIKDELQKKAFTSMCGSGSKQLVKGAFLTQMQNAPLKSGGKPVVVNGVTQLLWPTLSTSLQNYYRALDAYCSTVSDYLPNGSNNTAEVHLDRNQAVVDAENQLLQTYKGLNAADTKKSNAVVNTGGNAYHTEPKSIAYLESWADKGDKVLSGGEMTMNGTASPCAKCNDDLTAFAKKYGVKITYCFDAIYLSGPARTNSSYYEPGASGASCSVAYQGCMEYSATGGVSYTTQANQKPLCAAGKECK